MNLVGYFLTQNMHFGGKGERKAYRYHIREELETHILGVLIYERG